MTVVRLVGLAKNSVKPNCHSRNIFEWVNIFFNRVDEERRKQLGPDRTCAEWILRNGGAVRWTGTNEKLNDYNSLPEETTRLRISEIDATDSVITFHGFDHLKGCNYIERVILNRCQFLEDDALLKLEYIQGSLKYLLVKSCHNVTESGLEHLSNLRNLKKLELGDFPYIDSPSRILSYLKTSLPHCNVTFD